MGGKNGGWRGVNTASLMESEVPPNPVEMQLRAEGRVEQEAAPVVPPIGDPMRSPSPARVLAAFLTALLLVACSDSTEPRVPTTLVLDQIALELDVDEAVTVNAQILDQDGEAFVSVPEGYEIEWSVDDEAVATVEGGTIEGVGQGTAIVTVTAGDLQPAQISVEVRAAPVELFGEMSFVYSEARSGTFELSTDFLLDLQAGFLDPEWVITAYDTDFGSQDIVAQRVAEGGGFDLIWIWVEGDPPSSAGTFELDDGMVLFGMSEPWLQFDEFSTVEAAYTLEEGELILTEISEERMVGTFEFTAQDDAGEGLEVTEGSFDAPRLRLGTAAALSGSPPPAAIREGRIRPF